MAPARVSSVLLFSFILYVPTLAFPKASHHGHHQDGRDHGQGAEVNSHLPRDFTPTRYQLEIKPDLEEAKFSGAVTIHLECQEETDKITLHAHRQLNINIPKISVITIPKNGNNINTQMPHPTEAPTVAPVPVGAARLLPVSSSFVPENAGLPHSHHDEHHSHHEVIQELEQPAHTENPSVIDEKQSAGITVQVTRTERYNDKQWLVIHLEKQFSRGNLIIVHIEFSGELSPEPSNGIYLESYTDLTSRERRMYVATKFFQENARKVFPCFDETSYKVPIELTVTAPREYTVLSSTNEAKYDERGDWVGHQFEATPPMATFSLAFVVFNLQLLAYDADENVKIYGRRELEELPNTEKVVRIATKAIDETRKYLASPLPLGKLDIVVLPGTHSFAESDWGLIFFRESILTCSHCLGSQVTRDVASQWIGHLISPHLWDAYPMNKALTSFIAFSVELQIDNTTTPSSRMWSMNYPLYYEFGKSNQHSHTAIISHPHRSISIELVLRMFNYTLEKHFQHGLQYLLQQRSFKTFRDEDVWDALMNQGEDILPRSTTANLIAHTWLTSPSIPFVKVTRDYEKQTAEFEQHRFYRDIVEEKSNRSAQWFIPLVVISQNNLNFDSLKPIKWMEEEQKVSVQNLPSSGYFIIVNPEEVGPFIVNYDRKNWFLISEYLERNINNEQIPAGTRAKLVHDALHLAYGGKLRFDSALNVTRFLIHEKDPVVWAGAFNLFDHILRQLEGSQTSVKLQEYLKIVLTPAYEMLSNKSQYLLTYADERMLTSSKNVLCAAGYLPCIDEARKAWKIWMLSDEPDAGIPINLFHFCWVFKFGTKEEWEFGLQRYIRYPPHFKQADRYYLLKSLVSCPTSPDNVERLLNMTILGSPNDEMVRTLLASLSSEIGYTALFHLLEDNWDAVKSRYDTKESRLWENIVSTATMNFKTQDGYEMVSDIWRQRQKELGSASAIVDQALRRVRKQVKWSEDYGIIIDQWLDSYLSKV